MNLKKLFALLMAGTLLLGLFCACGNKDAEAIVGTWKAEIDMSEDLKKELREADMGDIDLSFKLDLKFDFNADKTFKMYTDEESVKKAFDGLKDPIYQYTLKTIEDMMAESGLEDVSLEDFLKETDMDLNAMIDELMKAVFPEDTMKELSDSLTTTGTYSLKDGKVLFTAEGALLAGESMSYEFKDGNLIFSDYNGTDTEFKELLPLTFVKQ